MRHRDRVAAFLSFALLTLGTPALALAQADPETAALLAAAKGESQAYPEGMEDTVSIMREMAKRLMIRGFLQGKGAAWLADQGLIQGRHYTDVLSEVVEGGAIVQAIRDRKGRGEAVATLHWNAETDVWTRRDPAHPDRVVEEGGEAKAAPLDQRWEGLWRALKTAKTAGWSRFDANYHPVVLHLEPVYYVYFLADSKYADRVVLAGHQLVMVQPEKVTVVPLSRSLLEQSSNLPPGVSAADVQGRMYMMWSPVSDYPREVDLLGSMVNSYTLLFVGVDRSIWTVREGEVSYYGLLPATGGD